MTEDDRGPFPLRIIDINDTQQLLKAAINTSGEATSSEEKMLIEMDGVSVTAKPRKDGRYQGYVLQNGKKKYLYGKSPARCFDGAYPAGDFPAAAAGDAAHVLGN